MGERISEVLDAGIKKLTGLAMAALVLRGLATQGVSG